VFRRDADRYWTLAGHPTTALFAAGHDSGMQLFKLERERPPMVLVEDNLFYVKGANILRRDLNKLAAAEASVGVLAQAPQLPAAFDYSGVDKALLVSSGGDYEIVSRHPKTGHGSHGLFLSQQRFVVLDADGQQIIVKAVGDNAPIASVPCPIPGVERIFPAPSDCVLAASPAQAVLFNPMEDSVLAGLPLAGVKRVCWSPDRTKCALMSRKGTPRLGMVHIQHTSSADCG
jgi:coatomer protein complex subunit alpha (xenin)